VGILGKAVENHHDEKIVAYFRNSNNKMHGDVNLDCFKDRERLQ